MANSKNVVIFAVVMMASSWACSERRLNSLQAQRAVDAWVVTQVPEGANRAKVQQMWLDSEVQRIEKLGVTVTDADYAKLELEAASKSVVATVKVLGVQELPTLNSATADLEMGNFFSRDTGRLSVNAIRGQATFVHYTDGRWVLNRVTWDGGASADRLNIAVR